MFIIRHPGESRVHRGGDEEELEGGSQQPCPFHLQPSLQVELEGGEEGRKGGGGRGQTDSECRAAMFGVTISICVVKNKKREPLLWAGYSGTQHSSKSGRENERP